MNKMVHKSIIVSAFFRDTMKDGSKLVEVLRRVKEDGWYDTVEFYFEGDLTQNCDVKNTLEELGFNSVYISAIPMKVLKLNLCDLDKSKRGYAINRFKGWIDLAYYFGSRKILIASGETYTNKNERKLAVENFKDSVMELCKYAQLKAKDYVLNLTLEYFNDIGEPFFLVGPSTEAKELCDIVTRDYKNLELTFDLSHVVQLREDPIKSFSLVKQYVNHVHIANCVIKNPDSIFFGDKHPPINIKDGELSEDSMRDFIEGIKNEGFFTESSNNKIIGIEIITPQQMDSMSVYKESSDIFLRNLSNIIK